MFTFPICHFSSSAVAEPSWDITNGVYSNKYIGVGSEEGLPSGVFLKSDGTKAYIVGSVTDYVYQYSLSTPWDISTATYDTISKSVGTEEFNPYDLFFSSDGTKFYITGETTDYVYQYDMTTAWDLSTANYSTKSFRIASQAQNPRGLYFKPDGSKMYIADVQTYTIFQYSLGTAWDISTTSYDGKSKSVATEDRNPNQVWLNPDGDRMFMLGLSNGKIFQYSLSTPWDISTASYDTKFLTVSTEDTSTRGMYFKEDGDLFYTVGATNDRIYQYSFTE